MLEYLPSGFLYLICFWITYFLCCYYFDFYASKNNRETNTDLSNIDPHLLADLVYIISQNIIISFPTAFILSKLISPILYTEYLVLRIIVSLLTAETWFYHVHRLFHKYFYKYHYTHHKYVQIYAALAVYCSKSEMIFVNLMASSLGPLLTGMTELETCIWVIFLAINTTWAHDGDLNNHLIHHRLIHKNYSFLGIWDRFYGSYMNCASYLKLYRS